MSTKRNYSILTDHEVDDSVKVEDFYEPWQLETHMPN